jgi:hypothetical protein
VCAEDAPLTLTAIALGSFALAVTGVIASWSAMTRPPGRPEPQAAARRFVAITAVGLNALIALLIALTVVPAFLLRPCE